METRDKMQIELVTENPDYGSGYFYAPLYLPATDADVRDAVQRARGLGRKDRYEDISVTDCPRLPALEDTRLDAPTIRELHFFASRLEELSEEELTVLNAVFKKRRDAGSFDDGLTMKDLINLTYGLSGVPVASNVRSDEQLGQLVIDSEMNEDVTSVPENARYLLDKARIGRLIRQNEDGVYLNGKCVLTSFYEMPEVYDGVQLPEKLHAIPDGFWLQIAKGPFDASKRPVYDADDPDERAIWISLPIGREEADGFARELGESRIEDCVFYGFETAVQQIGPGKFGSMRNLTRSTRSHPALTPCRNPNKSNTRPYSSRRSMRGSISFQTRWRPQSTSANMSWPTMRTATPILPLNTLRIISRPASIPNGSEHSKRQTWERSCSTVSVRAAQNTASCPPAENRCLNWSPLRSRRTRN